MNDSEKKANDLQEMIEALEAKAESAEGEEKDSITEEIARLQVEKDSLESSDDAYDADLDGVASLDTEDDAMGDLSV